VKQPPIVVSVAQALEINVAQTMVVVLGALIIGLGQPSEVDAAQAITVVRGNTNIAVAQVVETDLSQAITVVCGNTNITVAQISETDTAQIISVVSGSGTQTVTVGQITETDAAQPITKLSPLTVSVGQVSEVDIAQVITMVGGGVSYGGAYNAVSYFTTGGTVTIGLYDPITGASVSLISNACLEIDVTGLYIWDSTNLTTQPSGYQEYVWKMTNGSTYNGGILIMGLTAAQIATATRVEMDSNSIRLAAIAGHTDTLEASIAALPSAAQNATAVGGLIIEGTLTLRHALMLWSSIKHGDAFLPPNSDGEFIYRSTDGTSKIRIRGIVDEDGNRVISFIDVT